MGQQHWQTQTEIPQSGLFLCSPQGTSSCSPCSVGRARPPPVWRPRQTSLEEAIIEILMQGTQHSLTAPMSCYNATIVKFPLLILVIPIHIYLSKVHVQVSQSVQVLIVVHFSFWVASFPCLHAQLKFVACSMKSGEGLEGFITWCVPLMYPRRWYFCNCS